MEAGFVGLLMCSDPAEAGVAPHGGRRGVYTPNPIAASRPTQGDPVILDLSMSTTSIGAVKRAHAEKRKFPAAWLVDDAGNPTDDPAAYVAQPPGALLPVGGADRGHKARATLCDCWSKR